MTDDEFKAHHTEASLTEHDLSSLLSKATGGRCDIMRIPSQIGVIHLTIPAGKRREVERILYYNAPVGIHFEIVERP